MRSRLTGIFSLYIYYPFSRIARVLRTFSRRIRKKVCKHDQATSLPRRGLFHFSILPSAPRLVSLQKHNGNVTTSELGVLAALAGKCSVGSHVFEIGTFDGRTTMNLALNAPLKYEIITLDLPKDVENQFDLAAGERHMVEKEQSGERFLKGIPGRQQELSRIEQKFGDSARFDFSPFYSQCALFFVDGSHSYEYAKEDSYSALRCVAPGGLIVWHDYGVWKGVGEALDEIQTELQLDLIHLDGTSLVIWQCPDLNHLSKLPSK